MVRSEWWSYNKMDRREGIRRQRVCGGMAALPLLPTCGGTDWSGCRAFWLLWRPSVSWQMAASKCRAPGRLQLPHTTLLTPTCTNWWPMKKEEVEWRRCLFWSPGYQASWVLMMMTSQLLNKLIQFGSQPVLTIKLNIWRGRGYECGPLHFSGIIIYALDKGYWSQRFGYMNAQPQIQTRFCMKFRGKKSLMWQIFTDHITRCLYYNWVLKFLWFAHYTSDWLSHLPRHFIRRKSVWSPLYATLGQCARQEFFPPKLDLHKKLAIQVVCVLIVRHHCACWCSVASVATPPQVFPSPCILHCHWV